jgi:hypothetical protein
VEDLKKPSRKLKGSKFDDGKPRVELIEPLFILNIQKRLKNKMENVDPFTSLLYFRDRKGDDMKNIIDSSASLTVMVGFPELLEGVGGVLGFGAKKYSTDNWKQGILSMKLIGSAMRHWVAHSKGEIDDKESGFPHLMHLGCELMFIMYFIENPCEGWDNRPIKA